MGQTEATTLKKLAAESAQAIDFLNAISEQLKQQRRHFDDAVVAHCIRLINDYLDEKGKELQSTGNQGKSNGQHS